jgi:integrase
LTDAIREVRTEMAAGNMLALGKRASNATWLQGQSGLRRICRRAGLPERPSHVLLHTFATHAAMFGVNPWSLQSWMGHKRIEETMIYVSYANAHKTPIPAPVLASLIQIGASWRGSARAAPSLRALGV